MNKIYRLSATLISLFVATTIWAQYTITINGTSNGTITSSHSTAAQGTVVTLTVQPHRNNTTVTDNYYLSDLKVESFADAGNSTGRTRTPSFSGNVKVTKVDDEHYTFTMPMQYVEVTATFAQCTSIEGATITLTDNLNVTPTTIGSIKWEYDWLPHLPVVQSVAKTATLVEGKDYTVSGISSITNVETSDRVITITGIGQYAGTTTATYNVTPRSLEGTPTRQGATVQLSWTSAVYNHQAQKPTFQGVYYNGQTLTKGTDYNDDVQFSNASSENVGSYTVTVTGKGNFSGNVSNTYNITPMPIANCTVDAVTEFNYTGKNQNPTYYNETSHTISVSDGVGSLTKDTHYTLSFSEKDSDNETKAIGTYTMTLTAKDNTNYSGTKTIPYSIGSGDVEMLDITGTYTYTGSAVVPPSSAIEVYDGRTSTNAGTKLTYGTHYNVVCYNNINSGYATVTAVGIKPYNFSVSKNFYIAPRNLSNATINLSATNFEYNGKIQKPSVTVTDEINTGTNENPNMVSIIKSSDYIITNEGGTSYGTYQATIVGQNNYTGTVTKEYNITLLSLTGADVTLSNTSYIYDGREKKPTVLMVSKNGFIIPSTDYDVSYTTDATNQGDKQVTITPHNFATPGNAAVYNLSNSVTAPYSIAKRPISTLSISLDETNFVYNGNNQMPVVTVVDGNLPTTTTLTSSDYDVKYYTILDNINTEITESKKVGSYTLVISGKNNYTGSATYSYSINYSTSDNEFTVNIVPASFTYTGSPILPSGTQVVVKKGETTLTEGTDYSLSYRDNINVGAAIVTATGKGNYQFTQIGTFAITAKDISGVSLTMTEENASLTYNGKVQKPIFTIKDGSVPLVEDKDYTFTGQSNAGTYTITIAGTGNYTGSKTFSGDAEKYTIAKLPINNTNTTVTLFTLPSYVYDGNSKEPGVQLAKVGDLVIPSDAYTVGYSNNINASNSTTKAKATITAKTTSNFTGTADAEFTIQAKSVTSNMIILGGTGFIKESNCFLYTGNLQTPTVSVKDNSTTLTPGASNDYTVTSNPGGTEVGTYQVSIAGHGNYTGSASKDYYIIAGGSASFSIAAIPNQVYTGTAIIPNITVTAGSTGLTKGTDYDVICSNNVNVGVATVVVSGKGNYSGTKTVYFNITPKSLSATMISLTSNSFTYNGSIQKPSVIISDGGFLHESDYTVVNDGGLNAGDYHVSVTGRGNYTGTITGVAQTKYTINKLSISEANITLNTLDSYVYNGNNKTPGVSLVTIGSLNVPSSGYTIAYSNNKNASTTTSKATVTITGQGNFKDEASTTFSITPKAVSDDMISFNKEIFVFNGGSQKPEVTVKDGNTLLSSTNDYTLNNDGGIEAGLYYATITGKGNYTGTAKRSYNIITVGASIFSVSGLSDKEYNGSEYTPEPIVVNDDTHAQLTKGTDYTVSYLNNKNVGTATVIVTGIGSYAGTISRTFKITPKSLTPDMVTLSASSFSFNSLVQKPTVTVSDGTIMTDNDYTITNNGGIGCGTYHVIVTGKGNYSGQIDKTFDITQLDISNASVTLYELQSYAYDGKAKKPGVREVMVGSVTVPTTGYTISYGENINAGTATVTVTGQGDFKGSKTVNFTIEKKAVTDNMIILSNLEYTYNGNVQKPEVSVKDGETTLTLDTDYTLDNNGGVNAGVYDVKITGKGNYTGSAFKSFYINTREAGNFVVTLSEESMVYSGSELKPEVTVEDGGNALTAGKDYTVTYNDNINVGVATITVRGMGEYDGIKNKTFIIKPKEIKAEMVTLSSSGFTYNGMQQRPVVTVADGTFLTSNDYVVTNEGGINAGSYPVKVTGRNNYTGTVETSFSIGALDLAEAKVILYDLANYEYDGLPKNPGVREVAVGTMVVPTSSYTTEISANVNVGTVTVTVTGTGNFAGSASTTFEILQKPITTSMITLTPDIFYYNGSTQKPAVTVKHGKLTLREGTDFTLTNNGGRDAGTYEVNVKGMGNYTDEASASYNILTSEVTIFEITLETEKYVYDGTAREPAVTVKEGERVLTAVTDYTVKYANNVNAGTATVAVIGVGDYKGSQMKEFIIEPKPMTEDMVSLDKTTFTYNEEKQKPVVTVSDGDIMTEADYTITNEGGAEVGAYEVVVKGKNNYNGTITKKYNIVRSEMPVDPKPGEEQPGDAKINVSPTEEGSNEVKVSSITTSETGDASVTIPETCTINGQTYTVTGIADGAFANASNLKDIYLPETEKPLTIGKNAIPAQANVHVPLALLAEYALMPTMAESFRNGKVMSTVKAKNRYWTFASGVDVYVPDGLDVYIAREHNGSSVSIIQLTDNDLAVGGQRVIKANNGVLINSSGNDTEYVFVACAKRMTSGTAVSTDDNKDYGLRNCLIPVIVATHFEAGNYYFMKDNEFYRIKDESEDIKVPAGKAVLYMKSANASARVRLINGTTDISSENIAEDEGEWYTLEGMKLEGRPTKEGIYIHNKKKVYIRKYEK